MSIYIGSTELSTAYVGSTALTSIYIGSTEIWTSSGTDWTVDYDVDATSVNVTFPYTDYTICYQADKTYSDSLGIKIYGWDFGSSNDLTIEMYNEAKTLIDSFSYTGDTQNITTGYYFGDVVGDIYLKVINNGTADVSGYFGIDSYVL